MMIDGLLCRYYRGYGGWVGVAAMVGEGYDAIEALKNSMAI
jgi:hypothetical protein